MEPIYLSGMWRQGMIPRDWEVTVPHLFHCIIHTTLIRFYSMGHVWNITRWGHGELKYYKLQALQMGKVRIPVQYMGNPEYLSQIWELQQKNGRWAEDCNSAGSSQASETESPPLAASGLICHPDISRNQREDDVSVWESKIASMELQQVKGSRMNGVGWEEAFYKANLKKARWSN